MGTIVPSLQTRGSKRDRLTDGEAEGSWESYDSQPKLCICKAPRVPVHLLSTCCVSSGDNLVPALAPHEVTLQQGARRCRVLTSTKTEPTRRGQSETDGKLGPGGFEMVREGHTEVVASELRPEA